MAVVHLPLAESPIGGYMLYSYHLAVTFAHVDAAPWLYENFVQLQCAPEQLDLQSFVKFTDIAKGEVHFTEGSSRFNPWLQGSAGFSKLQIAEAAGSVIDWVCDRLAEGMYVETFVDEFYLSGMQNGGRAHFRHRLLLSGFDSAARIFDIVGFDQHGSYRAMQCSFDEFRLGFESVEPQAHELTRLFKPAPGLQHRFDPGRLALALEEYLAGINTRMDVDLHGNGEAQTYWFGSRCHEFLATYLKRIRAHNIAVDERKEGVRTRVDFRGCHMMWEHKRCMTRRLRWLASSGHLPDAEALIPEFLPVERAALQVRDRVAMCNKGMLPPGQGGLDKQADQILVICEAEKNVLDRLLGLLRRA